jgi:hypothetical protein
MVSSMGMVDGVYVCVYVCVMDDGMGINVSMCVWCVLWWNYSSWIL